MRRVACALLHHPVLDRQGAIVTAAITNIDLHDISRSALSMGLDAMFVAHPVAAQRELATRIKSHWVDGSGGKRIPDRKPALSILRVVETLDDALSQFGEGGDPAELWTTSAGQVGLPMTNFASARAILRKPGPPVVLVFGTGWGLAPEIHQQAARLIEPVASPRADGYNHLSVRAAAAIMFDRLCGVV